MEKQEVYIVTYSDWDEHWIYGVFGNKEVAEECLNKLSKKRVPGGYDIETFEVEYRSDIISRAIEEGGPGSDSSGTD